MHDDDSGMLQRRAASSPFALSQNRCDGVPVQSLLCVSWIGRLLPQVVSADLHDNEELGPRTVSVPFATGGRSLMQLVPRRVRAARGKHDQRLILPAAIARESALFL